ncbi:poly(3-hydroxybutyrate) depolymerase [Parafrankia soli]|uniref:Poly(3-hydroxybutyrate) depolymerase n=1 Tax=Parafrankia soli TaxID=2599596 RepID=A0A1S1QZ51_9ACTN|nr:PHB depolymerase family esterase [Parafrankia soli]OHV38545.1 poly(3-hydroxybutyrate) depolymerase [Parafrankia soli]
MTAGGRLLAVLLVIVGIPLAAVPVALMYGGGSPPAATAPAPARPAATSASPSPAAASTMHRATDRTGDRTASDATDAGPVYTKEIALRSGRSYDLHTTVRSGAPRPLVVLLHAYAHTAADMRDISGATPFADEHGFVLAYGHAVDGSWNAGTCCAGTNGQDDIAYLRELVADVARRTPVDRSRVYVWGYSNGGMLAARAVCEAPDVFAAAGVVAGHLLVPCDQARIRMMHIHGTADTTVPWRGGWSDYVHVTFPDARTESERVTSSSTVAGIPWDGGHAWPWWATGTLWGFSQQWSGTTALPSTR